MAAPDPLFEDFASPDGIYLLNHSVGVPPGSIRKYAINPLLSAWMSDPEGAWPRWMADLDGFHDELSTLFNHDAPWFCHQVNVSSATSKIVHSLPFERRRPVIVTTEQAFPSLGYVAHAARSAGYRTRFIPKDADAANPETWRAALSDDTGIALITHAVSNTGSQLPVDEILQVTRSAGVVSIVDVAQSAGIVPIDLRMWRADFVVGTSVKWLCGGPGAGFLWANPEIIDRCQPLDVGWFSHEDPFEFDIHDFRLAPDARRFWGGTPSPIPAALARHSIATINRIGLADIHQHNLELTQRLIDGLDPRLLASPREPSRRSGTVVVDPGATNRAVTLTQMAALGIQVDERADGIRISPHVINTEADIDAVLDVMSAQ